MFTSATEVSVCIVDTKRELHCIYIVLDGAYAHRLCIGHVLLLELGVPVDRHIVTVLTRDALGIRKVVVALTHHGFN